MILDEAKDAAFGRFILRLTQYICNMLNDWDSAVAAFDNRDTSVPCYSSFVQLRLHVYSKHTSETEFEVIVLGKPFLYNLFDSCYSSETEDIDYHKLGDVYRAITILMEPSKI